MHLDSAEEVHGNGIMIEDKHLNHMVEKMKHLLNSNESFSRNFHEPSLLKEVPLITTNHTVVDGGITDAELERHPRRDFSGDR